jgi:hypothetical protein
VVPLFLTVFAAGALGGGVASGIGVVVIGAVVALVAIAAYTGVTRLLFVCDESRDS